MANYWSNKLGFIFCVFGIVFIALFQETQSANPSIQLVWLYTINGYGGHDFFLEPQGIWFDSNQNEILIADTDNDSIGIFDTNGKLRFRFGREKRVSSPVSVATDSAGNIYWSEANTLKVKQADFRGELIKEYDFSKFTLGQEQFTPLDSYSKKTIRQIEPDSLTGLIPGKLFIDKTDNLYVIDRANGQVVKLNSQGQFMAALDGIQENQLQSEQYAGLQITKDDKLYLLSSLGTAIHTFDTTNHLVQSFGEHGSQEFNFSFPTGFAIDRKGRIWIVDSFQHRLKIFSSKGDYLFQLGTTGKENGQFYFPIDLVFDSQGRVYVLEKGTNRVQVFEIKE